MFTIYAWGCLAPWWTNYGNRNRVEMGSILKGKSSMIRHDQ